MKALKLVTSLLGGAFLIGLAAAFIYPYLRDESFLTYTKKLVDILEPKTESSEIHTTDMPWCQMLRDQYSTIRDEFLEYRKDHGIESATHYYASEARIDRDYMPNIPWLTLPISSYGLYSNKLKYFPKTSKLLQGVPNAVAWFFSVLLPGKR